MLHKAYGEDCLSRTQCHEWYQRFRSSRTSIEDDPKSGRPSTSMDDDHVEKLLAVIRQNRRLTVREVAEEVGTCKSSCNLILTDKLKMRRVVAKFVPRPLKDAQKENLSVRSCFIFRLLMNKASVVGFVADHLVQSFKDLLPHSSANTLM